MSKISANQGKVTIETDTAFFGLLTWPKLETHPVWGARFVADVSIQKKPGVSSSNLDPTSGRLALSAADMLAIEIAMAGQG